MQQLALFNKNQYTLRRRKRPVQRSRKSHGGKTAWDLWTQDQQVEREMALFFLDIRNFTPLVEQHDAIDIIHLVKKLFSTFQHIIRVHHGRIIETTGDGFYAAFGLDTDIKQAVNDAVLSAQKIFTTLRKMNAEYFEYEIGYPISIGVGIHAGKVATGSLSLTGKGHLVVMGYAVNVAARIQAATRDLNNEFIVSSKVYQHLQTSVDESRKLTVSLKGVSAPVDVVLLGGAYSELLNKQADVD